MSCPADNKNETDINFWDHGPNLNAQIIGWIVAGLCTLFSTIISFYLIFKHCQNYHKPNQQRYIIRIILLIPIFSITSWLSYRFLRYSEYFETIRSCYEAFVIFSFFALLTQYVGDNMTEEKRRKIFYVNKNDDNDHDIQFVKMRYPVPSCCITYNPNSNSHLLFIKWGVLQYVVVNLIIKFTALLTNALGVYCEGSMSFRYAKVYCTIIGFLSVATAMYALITFYLTIKDAIKEENPFYKFLCIKLVIFLTIIQNIIFSMLEEAGVIKGTEYWTSANISHSFNAFLLCFEMLLFAILYLYAFGYRKYRDISDKFGKKMGDEERKHIQTPISKGILDAFNPKDLYSEIKFVCKYIWFLISGKKLPDSTSKALNIYAAIHSHDQRTYNPLIVNNHEVENQKGEEEV
ncbi:7839_t:CDS:2 [Diversispora eburnea]|uniref:7839_t:CDS:1 n=1 Tax=Diversispora eburnea TaxID=1213867 RepID=A0A9N9B7R7_9GLOM|nr:7839_t:CDS:2 [Diversispora eburnea]